MGYTPGPPPGSRRQIPALLSPGEIVLSRRLQEQIDAQGPPKRIKPIVPAVKGPQDPCAQVKCAYCGRYGALGQCQGCGAPNRPVA